MQQEIIESIKTMPVNGTRLELPKEQMTNYPQVKSALLKAGGKYKKCGFEFGKCAQAMKDRLVGGEKVNDKKKFQFFPTPQPLAKRMVEMANIDADYLTILEPSAGQGAIAKEIEACSHAIFLEMVELDESNIAKLQEGALSGYAVEHDDFLKWRPSDEFKGYDRIVANPPFTKNQDIDHVLHMYSMLGDGGRIVTLTSPSWVKGSQKKQVAFREWLEEVGATVEELPEGTFKESGTNIRTMLLVIDK